MALGTSGKISVYSPVGTTNINVNIQGYTVIDSGVTGGFMPVSAARLADTSVDGSSPTPLTAGAYRDIQVTGRADIPAGATAAFVNVTVLGATAEGFLKAYPPNLSEDLFTPHVRYAANGVSSTSVVAQLGPDGKLRLKNQPGGSSIDVTVDVQGYFTGSGQAGGGFNPSTVRLYDSRNDTRLLGGASREVQVAGVSGIPLNGTGAVALNLTVLTPDGDGSLAIRSADEEGGSSSSLTYNLGESVSNLVIARPSFTGNMIIKNEGTQAITVVLDAEGSFSDPYAVSDSERASAITRVNAIFQAQNDVWRDGQTAVDNPNAALVSAAGGNTAEFSAGLVKALELRKTVTDEGLLIDSTTTNVQMLSVRSSGANTLARARVTLDQVYRDPSDGSVSAAKMRDDFDVLLSPQTSPSSGVSEIVREVEAVDPVGDDSVVAPATSERASAAPSTETESTYLAARGATWKRSYNASDFADYALKWTKDDKMNPDYPEYENNCANFVSQSLDVAGWPQTGGVLPNNLENWDPNLTGPAGASYTWVGAKYLYVYVTREKDLKWMPNIWDAHKGDLYFVDWDNDGDSKIDHVVAVTGRTKKGTPRISSKTANRHNVLLTTWLKIIEDSTGPDPIWYGREDWTPA